MSQCACHPQLQGFHDGELDADRGNSLRSHLETCDECSRELRQLRELSNRLTSAAGEEMTDIELSRLHGAMDEVFAEQEPVTLRFPWFKALCATAASILVISGAWMMRAPVLPGPAQNPGLSLSQNDWMRIAVTLQVDPLPLGMGEPDVADAQTANWFLENLDGTTQHADN